MRPQRDDIGAAFGPRGDRAFDVGQRHGADLALILCQDHIGRDGLQALGIDLVDGEALLNQRLDGDII